MKKHKHAVIAIDLAIFTIKEDKLQVLLMKMGKEPFKDYWALPGRLVASNENLRESAENKFYETTKIKDIYMEQLYTFGNIERDPFGRVVSTAYIALLAPNKSVKEKENKLEWRNIEKLPKLAYDHKKIVQYGINRLKSKLSYSNIIYSLLTDKFTLSQMQKDYEIILNKKLDKRNFRKKIFSLNLIKKTGKKDYGAPNRPAELYEFADKQYMITEIL